MPLKITFLLPGHSARPTGGFRVVYEYANRLIEQGHEVFIVNAGTVDINKKDRNLRKIVIYILRLLGLLGGYKPKKWLSVNKKIKIIWVYDLNARNIPNADIIVATAWQTAEWLKDYGHEKGKKFYLIHDYEHYMSANNELKKRMAITYNSGFYNIVTSPAGLELLSECKAPYAAKISNGIDIDVYKLSNDIDHAGRNMIGFPARIEYFKGTRDIVQALTKIKDEIGSTYKIWAFGPKKILGLPSWVKFYFYPDNETVSKMMNKTAIFVLPSHYEGWGLPGAEAMACGAALVTTDNVGVRDYAVDLENALFAKKENPDNLAQKIMTLINDPILRLKIAKKGHGDIQRYTWERATEEMVVLFNKKI